MKRTPPRHSAEKAPRSGPKYALVFLLALTLILSCSVSPVLGAEPQPDGAVGTAPVSAALLSRDLSEDAGVETVLEELPWEQTPAPEPSAGDPDVEALPSLKEASPSPAPGEASPQPSPEVKKYTVVFDKGVLGKETFTVDAGCALTQIPDDPAAPAAVFDGWYDEAGNRASPYGTFISRDRVFTARYSRDLDELLKTGSDHEAYIGGYDSGMFKPEKSITRAEAAKIFYSLLRSQDWGSKNFTDVKPDKWYAVPVGVIAALGIVSGYPDGTFQPSKEITRAEFVKMAVSFTSVSPGSAAFTDVAPGSWAAPYISTAASLGWVDGYSDGTFRPSKKITRAQAVTIVNRMLGRIPDSSISQMTDAKNFYDVFPSHWAYGQIEEAATEHSAYQYGGAETWNSYEHDYSTVEKSGWVQDGKDKYYLDAATRKFLRGETKIDGVTYWLDSTTGKAVCAFRKEGNWRWYYKDGIKQTDISGLGVTKGPYLIKVYKPSNYLIIFAKDGSGVYNTPVCAMRVSCGEATLTGTYYSPDKYRWLQMIGDTWAQWCTQIQGNYLLHSVPNWTHSNMDLEVDEYNHLGETRSLGCIRLNCKNAKWIFDNCALGTRIDISATETAGPLPKPPGIQIPSWHTWDPTDPTAYYLCKQRGCH